MKRVALLAIMLLPVIALSQIAASQTAPESGAHRFIKFPPALWCSNGAKSVCPAASSDPKSTSDPVAGAAVTTSAIVRRSTPGDFNRDVYRRNKLEFSLEGGGLPFNIPFVFDCFSGQCVRSNPVHYTLVPFLVSLGWQTGDVRGPWIFRGNWEMTFSGSYTMIPRGPETRYFAYITGFRRNFVRPNWRLVPYLEARAGVGDINANPPQASNASCWVPHDSPRWFCGQGQALDFTVGLEGGARYHITPRFAIFAGVEYMHISDLYMSEPKYEDLGINNVGPAVGIDFALHRYRHAGE